MSDKLAIAFILFWVVFIGGGLWYRTTTDAARAARCPVGTVYDNRINACVPGFRPWED